MQLILTEMKMKRLFYLKLYIHIDTVKAEISIWNFFIYFIGYVRYLFNIVSVVSVRKMK